MTIESKRMQKIAVSITMRGRSGRTIRIKTVINPSDDVDQYQTEKEGEEDNCV